MKIVLGIFVVLILVAIAVVGFLLLRKKQAGQSLEETTPTLPPFVQDSVDNMPQPQAEPTTPPINHLLTQVDGLVNAQRYDEATNELKRLLITNPTSAAVMLKLLQVYALTGNQNAFSQLHQTLLGTGDEASIRDAHTLQILLNDNVAPVQAPQPAVAPTPQQSSALDDGLSFDDLADFGVEDTQPQTTTTAKNSQEDFAEFDLGDFNSPPQNNKTEPSLDLEPSLDIEEESFDLSVFDETPKPKQTAQKSDEFVLDDVAFDEDDSLLDLSAELDDLTLETPSQANKKADEQDFGLDLAFEPTPEKQALADDDNDLAFDLAALATDTATSDDKHTEVDLGLDLNLGETQTPTKTAPSDLSFDDLSFGDNDLQLETTPKPESKLVQDDFALDLNLDNANTNIKKDIEADIDFGLDDNLDFAAPQQDSKPNQDNDFALDDNIGFELDALTQNPVTKEEQSAPLVTKLEDFQVDFGKHTSEPTADNLGGSVDFAATTAQPSSDIVAPSATPVLSSMIHTTSSLDNVEQFDNSQITLDLAKNYLNLGEHDSAKRLLQEVMQSGNATQQQQAYTLLHRLG